MDAEKIEKAIKNFTSSDFNNIGDKKALDILLKLAQYYLTVLKIGDIPKEKVYAIIDGWEEDLPEIRMAKKIGFNTCRSLILAQIVKRDEEIKELKHRTNFTYCAYCGKEFPLDEDALIIG